MYKVLIQSKIYIYIYIYKIIKMFKIYLSSYKQFEFVLDEVEIARLNVTEI